MTWNIMDKQIIQGSNHLFTVINKFTKVSHENLHF